MAGTSMRRAISLGATVVLTSAVVAVGAGGANAAPSGSHVYTFTGHSEYLCVPDGVTALSIEAVGGAGGNFGSTGDGGLGARVTATVAVTAGTEVVVTVGQWGHGHGGYGDGHGGRHGLSPGDGLGFSGAGGGGSSAVKSTDHLCGDHSAEDSSYLVVAGGGGGAGGDSDPAANDGGDGGNAGKQGSDGTDGVPDPSSGIYGGEKGCGGRQAPDTACNNSRHGGDGTDIQKDMDGGGAGGGGGGGYNGGGKGHGAHLPFNTTGGGGGGGGASYVKAGSTDPRFGNYHNHKSNGFVVIHWGEDGEDPGGGLSSDDPLSGLFGSS
ncbi:MAG: hypothetical protein C0482_05645 [Gordonia sp.]|nr:hypothetical protein [Gordonia sp. (in: high G+C Gram-positive bacteria)]